MSDNTKGTIGAILVFVGVCIFTFLFVTWITAPSQAERESERIQACTTNYHNANIDQVSERGSRLWVSDDRDASSLKELEYRIDEQAKEFNRFIDLFDCIH